MTPWLQRRNTVAERLLNVTYQGTFSVTICQVLVRESLKVRERDSGVPRDRYFPSFQGLLAKKPRAIKYWCWCGLNMSVDVYEETQGSIFTELSACLGAISPFGFAWSLLNAIPLSTRENLYATAAACQMTNFNKHKYAALARSGIMELTYEVCEIWFKKKQTVNGSLGKQ